MKKKTKKQQLKEAPIDPAVLDFVKQSGIDPNEYVQVARYYENPRLYKGPRKTPKDIVRDIMRFKNPDVPKPPQSVMNLKRTAPDAVAPKNKVPAPPSWMKKGKIPMSSESITLTKSQLKNLIKESVVKYEKQKYVKRVIKEHLIQEAEVRDLATYYLTEGPLSNVWGGIKSAGQSLGQAGKQAVGQATQAFSQGRAQAQAQDQVKQAQKQVTDALKSVSNAKQKYNQQILKNAELINTYHDAVLNLYQVFGQAREILGPGAQQLEQDVQNALNQLSYDLESERQQVTNFLQNLSQETGQNADQLSAQGQQSTQQQRDAESAESGRSSQGRDRAKIKGAKS